MTTMTKSPRPRYVENDAKHGPDRRQTHDYRRTWKAYRTQFDETPVSYTGEVVGPAVDVDIRAQPCEDCGSYTRLLLKAGSGHMRRRGMKITVGHRNTQCAGCGKLHYEIG
jgi:hypothetical protein